MVEKVSHQIQNTLISNLSSTKQLKSISYLLTVRVEDFLCFLQIKENILRLTKTNRDKQKFKKMERKVTKDEEKQQPSEFQICEC